MAFFFLSFPPKKPSQAKRKFLIEFEATHETPKQLKASSNTALTNRK